MPFETDHFFMFVRDQHEAETLMRESGLRVNYSRAHPGQGTRNLCACLDDVFLELLWLDDTPISAESERISLGTRGRGHGSPLGIAWRGDPEFETEAYNAPFLPEGMAIPVASASLDPALPFVFGSPGGARPVDWANELAGSRQSPGLLTMGSCRVVAPAPETTAILLQDFPNIEVAEGEWGLEFELCNESGNVAKTVRWRCNQKSSVG